MEFGLNKLPWYGQVGVFLVVALGLFLVFRFLYVEPQREALALLQAELEQKRSEVAQAERDQIELERFQGEVDDLNNRLQALSAVLPERQEAAALLRRLVTFAQQSNLTLRAFRPQAPVIREMHSEWPIRLELDGTYHNLGSFFDRVSKFPRIIRVGDVLIRPLEPARLNATVAAECTATTFVLNETAPAEAPGA